MHEESQVHVKENGVQILFWGFKLWQTWDSSFAKQCFWKTVSTRLLRQPLLYLNV